MTDSIQPYEHGPECPPIMGLRCSRCGLTMAMFIKSQDAMTDLLHILIERAAPTNRRSDNA